MLQEGLLAPQALEHADLQQRLDELIARVRKHPALECYFIADEPSAAAFPALARLVAYLREKDPDHYAYINLFPSYADNAQLGTKGDTVTAYREHLRQFIEIVKPSVLSYDHYHFLKSGDGGHYFLNLGLIREAALQAHIPFMNIVQASHGLSIWRPVSTDELRWLVYTTLAYGAAALATTCTGGRSRTPDCIRRGRRPHWPTQPPC